MMTDSYTPEMVDVVSCQLLFRRRRKLLTVNGAVKCATAGVSTLNVRSRVWTTSDPSTIQSRMSLALHSAGVSVLRSALLSGTDSIALGDS